MHNMLDSFSHTRILPLQFWKLGSEVKSWLLLRLLQTDSVPHSGLCCIATISPFTSRGIFPMCMCSTFLPFLVTSVISQKVPALLLKNYVR